MSITFCLLELSHKVGPPIQEEVNQTPPFDGRPQNHLGSFENIPI